MAAASGSYPERQREADVALDHVTHVGNAVAELQGSLQSHAERETGVDARVNAAGAQHIRIDHAAAAPLHPAGSALLVCEPDVDLGGRLGEREEVRAQPGAALRAELRAGGCVERD